jgi:hypothetical protein
VAIAVARQEHDVGAGELAEGQRPGRFAVRRAHHLSRVDSSAVSLASPLPPMIAYT